MQIRCEIYAFGYDQPRGPSFTKIGHCVLIGEAKVYLLVDEQPPYIYPSIHLYNIIIIIIYK